MIIIYSCPDCEEDLEPDTGGWWCPRCEHAVTFAEVLESPDD